MPELKHSELSEYLKKLKTQADPQVFFIWGEEFLCRKAFDAVVNFLLPGKEKAIGYELLEGEDAVIPVMVERISTYSVFQDRRVVAIKNTPLFSQPGTVAAGFTPENIDLLKEVVEKGFPQNHYLVMTSPAADRRRLLFNTLKERGMAVDCTVPKGSRKTDQAEQTKLLRITMKEILDRTGKGIEGHAFNCLTNMTGFDPAVFADNLERLATFIGNRDMITAADVESVVKRTKKDALFELNNAVSDRKLNEALFYLRSLCNSGFHPLQLLTALTNHFRKILVVKNFIISEKAKGNPCWHSVTGNYNLFMKQTMPWIIQADKELLETLGQWKDSLASGKEEAHGKQESMGSYQSASPKKGKGKKAAASTKTGKKSAAADRKKATTDLTIAPNPKNGYPVFQTFIKSDRFSRAELLSIFMELGELDHKLKTSSDSDPLILIEALIIGICTPERR